MSSILTALKKIESAQFQQEEVRVLSRAVFHRRNRNLNSQSFRLKAKTVVLIFLVVVWLLAMSFIGWKYLTGNNGRRELTSIPHNETTVSANLSPSVSYYKGQALSEEKNTTPKVSVAGSREKNVINSNEFSGTTPEVNRKQAKTTLKSNASSTEKPLALNMQDNVLSSPESTPQTSMENKAALPSDFKHRQLKSEQITIKKTVPAPITPGNEIPIYANDASPLELQAIAWSDNPGKRIAVINSSIVREGGTVEGLMIAQINENDVILRQGGKFWKIVFKLQ